jgi:ABC-type nitrate/sulfonate/bicarbonate transport system ATPase subunit
MANVQLRGVTKRFGGHAVVDKVTFDVRDGEFVVLVGPSGCGKTTVLRMIAGLEEITEGELLIEGLLANDLSPAARGIAMVFQSYALYPHMTVSQNMGFGLKLAGVPKLQIDAAVRQAATVLHIEHLLERLPAELSGGQRQRVAIGRAITRKPKVFLFDEPLSNLDAAMRVRVRVEFSRLAMPSQPTYEDIERFAQAHTDKPNQLYGICLRGQPGWGANMALISTRVNTFGGGWFDESWHPTIDTPEWKSAVGEYIKLLTLYGPPGTSSNNFNENLALFAGGHCAIWIDATVGAGILSDPRQSGVATKVLFLRRRLRSPPAERTGSGLGHWGSRSPRSIDPKR